MVLTCVYMMSASKIEPALSQRLSRLTGADAACCVPEYQTLSQELRGSAQFRESLKRIRAVSDENRLLAVSFLKHRGEVCACEIQAVTGLTHATVSHHMAVLEDAGWIESRRQGKWAYYRLASKEGVELP